MADSNSDSEEHSLMENLDILETYPIRKLYIHEAKEVEIEKGIYLHKKRCKILKFSKDWSCSKIKHYIDTLQPCDYPNLFVFIIENSFNEQSEIECLKGYLYGTIGKDRPIILQIKETSTKRVQIFYSQREISSLIQVTSKNSMDHYFPSFLFSLKENLKSENLINMLDKEILNLNPLAIRFVKLLDLPESLYTEIIMKYAASGTREEFNLAMFSVSDNFYGGILSKSDLFSENLTPCKNSSVLMEALKYKNDDIVDFLTTKYRHFICDLPFQHQIEICNMLYSNADIITLCHLIKNVDFPFPNIYEEGEFSCLDSIAKNRNEFHQAIEDGNVNKIKEFIEENEFAKKVYSPKNKSALFHAFDCQKDSSFKILLQHRFRTSSEEKLQDVMNCKSQTKVWMCESLEKSKDNLISLLLSKTSIVNNPEKYYVNMNERFKKIRGWYESIYQIDSCAPLINIVAQANDLKIIFDFNSESISAKQMNQSRFIIIAAGFINQDEKKENEIKGAIAHEFAHYAMHLVFSNDAKPYYESDRRAQQEFEKITKYYKDALKEEDNPRKITSIVFRYYQPNDYHQELIVTIPELLATYSDSNEKLTQIRAKYEKLFRFYDEYVFLEFSKFLKKIENQRRTTIGMVEIKNITNNWEWIHTDEKLLCHENLAIHTNIPKFALYDLFVHYSQFHEKNIIIKGNILKNESDLKNLNELQGYNLIIDCTDMSKNIFLSIDLNSFSRYTIIVSNATQYGKVMKAFDFDENNFEKYEKNFNLSDLTEQSQKNFMHTIVNFQGRKIPLFSSVENRRLVEGLLEHRVPKDEIFQMITDEIFRLVVGGHELQINHVEDGFEDFLYISRKFFKITNSQKKTELKIQELPRDIEFNRYIILSDQAGSGKTTTLKHLGKFLGEKEPTRWISYVDLKRFIGTHPNSRNFEEFMVENVLESIKNYERDIFRRKFKHGDVWVFLDGYDEIAPKYAEYFMELIKSFNSFGGNQLWIASRDSVDNELVKELNIDRIYKLDQFDSNQCIELITRAWMLQYINQENLREHYKEILDFKYYLLEDEKIINKMDTDNDELNGIIEKFKLLNINNKNTSLFDYIIWLCDKNLDKTNEYKKLLQKYCKYHEMAKILCDKIYQINYRSVPLPLMYKVLSEIYISNKEKPDAFSCYDIYSKFVNIKLKQGQKISYEPERKKRRLTAEMENLKMEQPVPMEVSSSTSTNIENEEESEEEQPAKDRARACISPKDNKFNHNIRKIKYKKGKTNRRSSNSASSEEKSEEDSDLEKTRTSKYLNFNKFEDKKRNRKQNIIKTSAMYALKLSYPSKTSFFGFQVSSESVDEISSLGLININDESKNFIHQTFAEFFIAKFLVEYMTKSSEIHEDFYRYFMDFLTNIKFYTIRLFLNEGFGKHKTEIYELIPKIVDNFFMQITGSFNFNEIFTDDYGNIEDFLLKIFQRGEKERIKEIFRTVPRSSEPSYSIIEIDKKFDNFMSKCLQPEDLREIMKEKMVIRYQDGSFYYHVAQFDSEGRVKINKEPWIYFQELFGNDEEFTDILEGFLYEPGHPLYVERIMTFHNIAKMANAEVFKFFIEEFENVGTFELIRTMFDFKTSINQTFLHIAMLNKSLDFHVALWELIERIFRSSEIWGMIHEKDNYSNTIFHYVVSKNILPVVKFTWEKILKTIDTRDDLVEYLRHRGLGSKTLYAISKERGVEDKNVSVFIKTIMEENEVPLTN